MVADDRFHFFFGRQKYIALIGTIGSLFKKILQLLEILFGHVGQCNFQLALEHLQDDLLPFGDETSLLEMAAFASERAKILNICGRVFSDKMIGHTAMNNWINESVREVNSCY